MNRRIPTAVTMGVREFYRTPVLVAVLLVLPAYLIGAFVFLVPKTNIPVSVGGTTATVSMPAYATVFETAVSVAILSGIMGLFLVLSSGAADDRLRLAGYSDLELIVARVGTLGASVVVATAVTVSVAVQVFQPAYFWTFTAIVGLLGITYGVLGSRRTSVRQTERRIRDAPRSVLGRSLSLVPEYANIRPSLVDGISSWSLCNNGTVRCCIHCRR